MRTIAALFILLSALASHVAAEVNSTKTTAPFDRPLDQRIDARPTEWKPVSFNFLVKWDSVEMFFQEVSGLDSETPPIEYDHANHQKISLTQTSELQKTSNVTLKKGVVKSGDNFWQWLNKSKTNTLVHQTVTIHLLGDTGAPIMTWTLSKAWPSKIIATDLTSDNNQVAIEAVEISHQGLTITNN